MKSRLVSHGLASGTAALQPAAAGGCAHRSGPPSLPAEHHPLSPGDEQAPLRATRGSAWPRTRRDRRGTAGVALCLLCVSPLSLRLKSWPDAPAVSAFLRGCL